MAPSLGASAQVALRAADGEPVAVAQTAPGGGRTVATSVLHAAVTDVGAKDVLAAVLAFLEGVAP
jgi:predicted NAD/FAD-dependent oxidoreductase